MDKAQAVRIIHEEYQSGYSPSDIAQNLSQQLNAPFDLVYKFVMQTLGEQIEPAEEPIPPPSPPAQPEPGAPSIPGYETLPEKELEESAEEPGEAEDSPVEAVMAPVFIESAVPDLKALEQNPKVEKFVLQMLTGNQKTSDVVLAVCERTGLGWDEGQRLVARIAAKNRKMLQSRQNRLPLILSILALLAGALMVFAGLSEVFTIYTVLRTAQSNEELVMMAASQGFLRRALWSLVVGGALLLSGAVGVFIALRSQFD
jgi:hypothetical protein